MYTSHNNSNTCIIWDIILDYFTQSHIDNFIELSDLHNADVLIVLLIAQKINYCMELYFEI